MVEKTQPTPEPKGIYHTHIALARLLEQTAHAGLDAEYEATHDEMTGALNRAGLRKYLEAAEAPKAMLLVDGTNFKAINDKFGYGVGDLIIGETFRLLSESKRSNDVIARWGGDEFVIVLNGDDEETTSRQIIEEKRHGLDPIGHIDQVKGRIAIQMQSLLNKYKELRQVNFDLAVGGVEWPGLMDVGVLIAEVEKEMKTHKAEQHQNDRHQTA